MKWSDKDMILAICSFNTTLLTASKIGCFDVVGFLVLFNAMIVLVYLMNKKDIWK